MDNDIKYIWNTLWIMYKEFLVDFNVREYTRKATELVHKFDGNKEKLLFCQNLVITWTPEINRLAEEHRKELLGA